MSNKHIFNVVAYYHLHKVGNSKRHQNIQFILFFLFLATIDSTSCAATRCIFGTHSYLYIPTFITELCYPEWVYCEALGGIPSKKTRYIYKIAPTCNIFVRSHCCICWYNMSTRLWYSTEKLSEFTTTPPIVWSFDARFMQVTGGGAVNLM